MPGWGKGHVRHADTRLHEVTAIRQRDASLRSCPLAPLPFRSGLTGCSRGMEARKRPEYVLEILVDPIYVADIVRGASQ